MAIHDMIVAAVLAVVCWTDFKERRIPNWTVLVVLAVAVLTHRGDWQSAVFGFFCPFMLLFPFWAAGAVGGGDLKMVSALGAFGGGVSGLYVFLFASVPCMLAQLFKAACRGRLLPLLKSTFFALRMCAAGQMKTAVEVSEKESAPLGCWLLPGFLVWEVVRHFVF